MLTGFNTDIEFNGKVYHVQTEDRGGSEDPIFESLVYVKGHILESHRSRYGNLVSKGYGDEKLAQVLEAQHKRVIRYIRNGRYDPETIRPFGEGIISDRSFDEVVLDFVHEQAKGEKPVLEVEQPEGELVAGWTGSLKVSLRSDELSRSLGGCRVLIELVSDSPKPLRTLFDGETDRMGSVLAEVAVPDVKAKSRVRVWAETSLGDVEEILPVKKG